MMRILTVDDDPAVCEELRVHLENAGYAVESVGDGPAALLALQQSHFDLLILDVVMPKMRGFDLCKQIRNEGAQVAILFLSGQSDPIDKTLGLELGADDYLTKPFVPQELVARVRAILRRYTLTPAAETSGEATKSALVVGEITINFDQFKVTRRGVPVQLTATEFRLLACLASNRGRTLTRDELRDSVWGLVSSGFEQTITSTLSRLRNKLEDDPLNPRYLLTVRGFGYTFASE